jgi:hypothetical protein
MDKSIIAKVQSFGFDVYMRNVDDTWLYYTDGTNIGYLQVGGVMGLSLSTVHVPNRTTGTGFAVEGHEDMLTEAALKGAFIQAPGWAYSDDRASVEKYRDMTQFIKSSAFNQAYTLVPKEIVT